MVADKSANLTPQQIKYMNSIKEIDNKKLQKSDKFTPVLAGRKSRFERGHVRWDKDDALMNRSPYKNCQACSPQREITVKKTLVKKTVRPKTAKPVPPPVVE